MHKAHAPIKERNKQKRAAMHNLHYLKGIALDTFESRKAKLKNDDKDGRCFSPLRLYILPPLGCLPVSEITQTEISNTFAPFGIQKQQQRIELLSALTFVSNMRLH